MYHKGALHASQFDTVKHSPSENSYEGFFVGDVSTETVISWKESFVGDEQTL